LRIVLGSGDDYATAAKPMIDWDDPAAREQLIDSRARDGYAILALLDGRELDQPLTQAAALLATVLGQDLEQAGPDHGPDQGGDQGAGGGVFRIARRVAKDRVISTVDPDARHGHKSSARGFDGYKGHTAADPDSEIITATTVTPGNTGDAAVAEDLIADLLIRPAEPQQAEPQQAEPEQAEPQQAEPQQAEPQQAEPEQAEVGPIVNGDCAYGTGEFHSRLGERASSHGARRR
jgi:hypothetical protein